MEEVPTAQVFHAQGNVHHELHQGLQGYKLGREGGGYTVLIQKASLSRAAIPMDEPMAAEELSSLRPCNSLAHEPAGAAERDSLPTSIPPHSSAPGSPYLGGHFQPGAEQEAVQVSVLHERQDHHGLGHLQGAQLDAHPWETWTTHTVPWEKGSTQIPAGGWEGTAHTEELDDIGMVKVLHARCLTEELFNLPLGKVIHWEAERKKEL